MRNVASLEVHKSFEIMTHEIFPSRKKKEKGFLCFIITLHTTIPQAVAERRRDNLSIICREPREYFV